MDQGNAKMQILHDINNKRTITSKEYRNLVENGMQRQ